MAALVQDLWNVSKKVITNDLKTPDVLQVWISERPRTDQNAHQALFRVHHHPNTRRRSHFAGNSELRGGCSACHTIIQGSSQGGRCQGIVMQLANHWIFIWAVRRNGSTLLQRPAAVRVGAAPQYWTRSQTTWPGGGSCSRLKTLPRLSDRSSFQTSHLRIDVGGGFWVKGLHYSCCSFDRLSNVKERIWSVRTPTETFTGTVTLMFRCVLSLLSLP